MLASLNLSNTGNAASAGFVDSLACLLTAIVCLLGFHFLLARLVDETGYIIATLLVLGLGARDLLLAFYSLEANTILSVDSGIADTFRNNLLVIIGDWELNLTLALGRDDFHLYFALRRDISTPASVFLLEWHVDEALLWYWACNDFASWYGDRLGASAGDLLCECALASLVDGLWNHGAKSLLRCLGAIVLNFNIL